MSKGNSNLFKNRILLTRPSQDSIEMSKNISSEFEVFVAPLLEIKKVHNTNKNVEEIISSYRPQIFWKDKEIVKNQVFKWELDEAEKMIYKINKAELEVKQNYSNALNIVSDFVLNSAK